MALGLVAIAVGGAWFLFSHQLALFAGDYPAGGGSLSNRSRTKTQISPSEPFFGSKHFSIPLHSLLAEGKIDERRNSSASAHGMT